VIGAEQPVHPPSSSWQAKPEPLSLEENLNVADGDAVDSGGLETIEVSGGTWSLELV
jgi:hypothetical protein